MAAVDPRIIAAVVCACDYVMRLNRERQRQLQELLDDSDDDVWSSESDTDSGDETDLDDEEIEEEHAFALQMISDDMDDDLEAVLLGVAGILDDGPGHENDGENDGPGHENERGNRH